MVKKIRNKIHNIRDIFPNANLLEGATIAQSNDGIFKIMGFTIIRAGLSSNGNYYSTKVLREAAKRGVFNDKQIRTDHPDIVKPQSVNDVVGKITRTWFDESKRSLRGDGFFSSTVEDLVTKVKEGLIGDLSINARGITQLERVDGKLRRNVNAISKGFSVDLVCEAAAGGSLHEEFSRSKTICERMKSKMDELENLTIEELTEARPDIIAKIRNQHLEELKEAESEQKIESKDGEKETPSLTGDDVKNIVTSVLAEAFKQRDTEDEKRRVAELLNEEIEAAVDKILNESASKDSVKNFARKSLLPFAVKNFKKFEDIDEAKLSEERDRIIDDFASIAKDFDESSSKSKGQSGSSSGDKPRLLSLIS